MHQCNHDIKGGSRVEMHHPGNKEPLQCTQNNTAIRSYRGIPHETTACTLCIPPSRHRPQKFARTQHQSQALCTFILRHTDVSLCLLIFLIWATAVAVNILHREFRYPGCACRMAPVISNTPHRHPFHTILKHDGFKANSTYCAVAWGWPLREAFRTPP